MAKKKKKGIETIERFMKRRNKETGNVTIPQTKVSPAFGAGSHLLKAAAMEVGVVKPKMRKKLQKAEKKKKHRRLIEGIQ